MRVVDLLIISLALTCACSADSNSAADRRVAKLKAARDRSKDGIISTTTSKFDEYASGKSRPYSLIIFCTANHMMGPDSKLNLGHLRDNYALMTKHFGKSTRDSERVFFLEIELSTAKEVFHRLGVTSLPWVIHLAGDNPGKSTGMYVISDDDRMKPEDYKQYPWTPQNFADFVTARTHMNVGTVFVPTFFNNPFVVAAAVLSLIPIGWQAFRLYNSPVMGHPVIWASAVLLVYWFAVSECIINPVVRLKAIIAYNYSAAVTGVLQEGGLFNIIRSVPLVTHGQGGKVTWYTTGQGQLGAEGFAAGSLYLLFAICSSSVVFFPKWMGNGMMLRTSLYISLAIASFAVIKLVDFYRFKTGYQLRMYLFEGLQQH